MGDARTWPPDTQEAVRLPAVSALVEGRERAGVAALFKVSVGVVDNWWMRWQTGGRDGLLSRPRGHRAGKHQVLPEAEQAVLDPPFRPGAFRSAADTGLTGELVFRLYGVRFTEPGVGKYLERRGPTFRRPDKRAVEPGSGSGPGLARGDLTGDPGRSESGGGEVLFADQVGVRSGR
ncbi:helix-turn-helix domain-containing protein [Streptomyces sp. NPDC002559]